MLGLQGEYLLNHTGYRDIMYRYYRLNGSLKKKRKRAVEHLSIRATKFKIIKRTKGRKKISTRWSSAKNLCDRNESLTSQPLSFISTVCAVLLDISIPLQITVSLSQSRSKGMRCHFCTNF